MKLSNFGFGLLSLSGSLCLYMPASHAQATLKVGDKAPSLDIYKWIKGTPEKTFKKGQVYMVEFGATWCHPCGEAIPHITEIAKKYKDKLHVISVFIMEYRKDSLDISYVPRVEQYVKNMGLKMDYNVFVDGPQRKMENSWIHAAGLTGIPKTFIVDKDGMIAWMGNASPQTLDQVVSLVTANDYELSDAIEQSKLSKIFKQPRIESSKPMFMDGNGGDSKDFIYRSMLTKYHGEQSGNSDCVFATVWAKLNHERYSYPGLVQQIGVPLAKLYYMAYADTIGYGVATRYVDGTPNYPDTLKYPMLRNTYGKYWYKIIFELKDSSAFIFNYNTYKNLYNYSLAVTDKNTTAKFLQNSMQHDLECYFGYTVTVEERMMPCWNLISSEDAKALLKTKTPDREFKVSRVNDTLVKVSNAIIKDILIQFITNFSFGFSSYGIKPIVEAPFIDNTGITSEIDYDISDRDLQEFKDHDWNAALDFLHRHGLDLVKGQRETRVVVVKDPQSKK